MPLFLLDGDPRSIAIKATGIHTIKKILLNLYFWPLFCGITLALLVLIPPVAYILAIIKRRQASYFFRRGISFYGRIAVQFIPFLAPTKLIDKAGHFDSPVIFVANHLSSIDPYCFGVVDTEIAMLTSWPFNIPLFRNMMTQGEYIDTRKGWESIQKQAHRLLKKKCHIIIWPEGHRSRDGKLAPFERSAFRLAVEANCPVIPVCFVNTDKTMAPGCRFLSPHRPKVVLLPALFPDQQEKPRRAYKKLCEQTWHTIADELTTHQ